VTKIALRGLALALREGEEEERKWERGPSLPPPWFWGVGGQRGQRG